MTTALHFFLMMNLIDLTCKEKEINELFSIQYLDNLIDTKHRENVHISFQIKTFYLHYSWQKKLMTCKNSLRLLVTIKMTLFKKGAGQTVQLSCFLSPPSLLSWKSESVFYQELGLSFYHKIKVIHSLAENQQMIRFIHSFSNHMIEEKVT